MRTLNILLCNTLKVVCSEKIFKIPKLASLLIIVIVEINYLYGKELKMNYRIIKQGNIFQLLAGQVDCKLKIQTCDISVESLQCGGKELLSGPSKGISMIVTQANPNVEPEGVRIAPGQGKSGLPKLELDEGPKALMDIRNGKEELPVGDFGNVKWVNPIEVSGNRWHDLFNNLSYSIEKPGNGVWRLNIRVRAANLSTLDQVSIDQFYEIYEGYPVIRKWVEASNNSDKWLKIEDLLISDIELAEEYTNETILTIQHGGLRSGVVGFSNKPVNCGVIAVSEAPSGTKVITGRGAIGYAKEHFEWVVGPTERFISEPVFYYGFSGENYKTSSAVSTPMDRALENGYIRFLEEHIGIKANPRDLMTPLWCSWNNFGTDINDTVILEMAGIAARTGLKGFIIDAGYQGESSMVSWFKTTPNIKRFPDFKGTCDYIRSLGLELGLWVTSGRTPETEDRKVVPDGLARWWTPDRHKDGYAMSYSSKWRDYYVNDLVRIHDIYGVTYFKQDLRNIGYGDITYGHSARTLKESVLRGFRGFFEAQDEIKRLSPDIRMENTQENYWRLKAPVDLAVLKHSDFMFIPVQNYLGDGKWRWKDRQTGYWQYKPELMKPELLEACYIACERFYENRGLPVYALEHHAASMVNFDSCLTSQIQDMQICCWLMGSLKIFAGDLATLSEENIKHYHDRFEMVRALNKKYEIFRYFQFSGVPAPSKKDWFWWGKINDKGSGIVIIVRGEGGEEERKINIPWVQQGCKYKVRKLLNPKSLGIFKAEQLQSGDLKLRLVTNGQEILELEKIK